MAPLGTGVSAQESAEEDREPGGLRYTLSVDQGFIATDNIGFAPSSPGVTVQSVTDVTLGMLSETRASSLSLSGTYALRAVSRPNIDGIDTNLSDPRFSLNYSLRGADTLFRTYANFTQGGVEFIDPLTDFRDEAGEIVTDAPGFVDLSGSGDRQSLRYGANISLRTDRPFGLTFSADVSEINFIDNTTPALFDTTRTTLGARARFDISPVTRATLGLTQEQLTNEFGGESESLTLDGNITFTRPTSSFGLGFSTTDTGSGDRLGLNISQSYELPRGAAVSATLGLTRAAESGDTFATGSLSYSRPLPLGTLSAQASRSFSTNADGNEELQTSLTLAATHALSPIAQLGLEANFGSAEETASGTGSSRASLEATLGYDLTPDWSLEAGLAYLTRDTTDTARGNSTELSVTLSRDFTFRP